MSGFLAPKRFPQWVSPQKNQSQQRSCGGNSPVFKKSLQSTHKGVLNYGV